jgi:hypothetical protein
MSHPAVHTHQSNEPIALDRPCTCKRPHCGEPAIGVAAAGSYVDAAYCQLHAEANKRLRAEANVKRLGNGRVLYGERY